MEYNASAIFNATNETVPSSNITVFCSGLTDFNSAYRRVHGYVSLVVCVFGSVANMLNIAVLTRREMSSPTNALLTGLAVADLLVMLEYIPFAGHMYVPHLQPTELTDRYSYPWAAFVLFHSNFAQVCHTVSIWLTVTLAVWRYIAVAHPQRNREWCCMKTTFAAIISAYVVCPLLCIPLFLAFSIWPTSATVDRTGQVLLTGDNAELLEGSRNVTLYVLNISELGKANGDLLRQINFWVYSVVIKLIPCVALTELSRRLICALLETKRRRQQLAAASGRNSRVLDKERQTDRTTRMLLAVLLLFLITEFPQGILGLLSVWLGDSFFRNCYQNLGEVMDILALINSAVNFILYCAMSRQFRSTFSLLFRPSVLDRWLLVPQQNGDNNGCTTANNMTQVTQV